MRFLSARRRHPAAKVLLLVFALFVMGALYAVVAPAAEGRGRHRQQPAGRRGQGAVRGQLRLLPRAERRGPGHRHHPGPAAGRRRRRRGRVPGRDRPDADGPARGAGAGEAEPSTPRRRSPPWPRTSPRSAPARRSPTPEEYDPATVCPRRTSPAAASCSGPTARPATTSRAPAARCPNGKYAPALVGVSNKHLYEAMLTGPQQMPVFSDEVLTAGGQAGDHRLPERAARAAQPRRPGARRPRPGERGPVGLDPRSRASLMFFARLDRGQGSEGEMSDPERR